MNNRDNYYLITYKGLAMPLNIGEKFLAVSVFVFKKDAKKMLDKKFKELTKEKVKFNKKDYKINKVKIFPYE